MRTTKAPSAKSDQGFTLMEILVVIIVIGIIAAIAIPVFLNQRDKAFKSNTKANGRNIIPEVITARENQQAPLSSVTGNWWSHGSCQPPQVILKVSDPGFGATTCGARWTAMTNGIADASGSSRQSVARLLTDGWGRPMIFDENEGEGSPPRCANVDTLFSTGGETTFGTSKQIVVTSMPLSGFC